MRKIDKIILHCSASDDPFADNIKIIESWHKKRGFKKVGYHFFIRKNGTIELGRTLDEIGAHTLGHNAESIGVCLSGLEHFTEYQYDTAIRLIFNLITVFKLDVEDVCGHYEFNPKKTCPNIDMDEFRKCLSSFQKTANLVLPDEGDF